LFKNFGCIRIWLNCDNEGLVFGNHRVLEDMMIERWKRNCGFAIYCCLKMLCNYDYAMRFIKYENL